MRMPGQVRVTADAISARQPVKMEDLSLGDEVQDGQ